MSHQLWAIHWARQSLMNMSLDMRGIMIADEMGLGKTFTAIGLMLVMKANLRHLDNQIHGKKKPGQSTQERIDQLSPQDKALLGDWEYLAPQDAKDANDRGWGLLRRPSVVVVPSILVNQWFAALRTVLPQHNLVRLATAGLNYLDLNYFPEDSESRARQDNVHIVSYETYRLRFKSEFVQCKWGIGIFDESHLSKTSDSRTFDSLRQMNCAYRVLLTGTPVHHKVLDWVTQAQWMIGRDHGPRTPQRWWDHCPIEMKRKVVDLRAALKEAAEDEHAQGDDDDDDDDDDGNPSSTQPRKDRHGRTAAERIPVLWDELRDVVEPWFIRRWAETLLKNGQPLIQLPPLKLHHIAVTPTAAEKLVLDNFIKNYETTSTSSRPSALDYYHRLRNISFHPTLHDNRYQRGMDVTSLEQTSVFRELRKIVDFMITEADSQNRLLRPKPKVVIFTGLPRQADLVEDWLKQVVKDFVVYRLEMKMSSEERATQTTRFENEDNLAALVSTGVVGGKGLNLQSANHVVLLQKYWNLNDMRQAIARVWRLGQKRLSRAWVLHSYGFDHKARELHLKGALGLESLGLHGVQVNTEELYPLALNMHGARKCAAQFDGDSSGDDVTQKKLAALEQLAREAEGFPDIEEARKSEEEWTPEEYVIQHDA